MASVYIVTNAFCWFGVMYDQTFDSLEEAQQCADKINRLARRGLCEFAEIIEV